MSSPIQWGHKQRSKKADKGHTSVRYGWQREADGISETTYVQCECGTRLSGQGHSGGIASYVKHLNRELAKLTDTEPITVGAVHVERGTGPLWMWHVYCEHTSHNHPDGFMKITARNSKIDAVKAAIVHAQTHAALVSR